MAVKLLQARATAEPFLFPGNSQVVVPVYQLARWLQAAVDVTL